MGTGATLVTAAEVAAAAATLADVAVTTPLLPSPWSPELWLKPENLQPTGSFKIRGAYVAISRLSAAQRGAGVVTHSSGNHAQAVAYAARVFDAPATVVMPDVASPHKIEATRQLGAEVVLVPPAERSRRAEQLAVEHGLSMIPPYDHADVIAGQGTVGGEIADADAEVSTVLVPVGGGGLAAGVATALAARLPRAHVIGVEPALAADAQESLAAGELRPWPAERTYQTVADGLRTQLSELTLAHLTARLAGILTVTEEEILETTGALLTEARLVVEPSGAVSAAAWRHRRGELPAGRTVAVITGGNLGPARLAELATAAA
ncbi:pyridoxal-phosphate dependent enzyme [Natronosporangium hydrolyticum]|uniref:threonine ammonia-lyase n=2 Tax=Natronosporangium hydrolyticum TaxID=2811111 RepID=A0A895YHL9_9ACTN|nr:pyridoxal-phosphate dependent enzyme [Natronosporangium hydrolyticum]